MFIVASHTFDRIYCFNGLDDLSTQGYTAHMKYLSLWLLIILTLSATLTFSQDEPIDEDNDLLDRYFYTYHNPTGNHLIRGEGSFPNVEIIDIQLQGTPAWAVAYAMETAIWHIVMDNGDLEVVEVTPDNMASSLGFEPAWFEGAQPPIVGVSMVEGTYIMRSDESVSPLTHPIPVNDFEVLYINRDGDVVLGREEGVVMSLPLNVQPDARMVMNQNGQIALYANSTDQRYVHGIMGDNFEGSTLIILDIKDSEIRILARVDLPGEDIYEGIAPFWADLSGNGVEDLVTTVSNSTLGAKLRAYIWDGSQIKQEVDGPAIGQGNRWRHQLGAGALGPNGEIEIVDVLTPHIGGTLEFYRLDGSSLKIVEKFPSVTTHVIGSRNLDQTAIGDFNGDGQAEVLTLNMGRNHIIAVQHTENGAEEVWRLDAGDVIVTNIAPVELLEGRLGLAVGTRDGRLRIWMPK